MKWVPLYLILTSWLQAQIYADFETSAGDFTVQLHYEKTPKTVANFIGLAEGSRPWIDSEGNIKNTPFYNGITFHRVIDGFMNQFGSPNGQGTDGPGYSFADEFDATLDHSTGYVLSMANAGPHTNGSQLFITVSPQTQLDNVHTVFGFVPDDGTSRQTINAINTAPKSAGNSQVLETPITITGVTIRREGSEAQAFDINNQGLPTITTPTTSLDSSVHLTMQKSAGCVIPVYTSTDLSSWSYSSSSYLDEDDNTAETLDLSALSGSNTSYFFRTPLISYQAPSPSMPSTLSGRTLSYNEKYYGGVMAFTFTSDSGGTLVYTPSSGDPINGAFSAFISKATPHKFDAFIATNLTGSSGYIRYQLTFGLDTNTPTTLDGRASGRLYFYNGSYSAPISESGAFSLTR